MSRTLVVTNDFPTRQGGIETFVLSLVRQLPADEVVVYTASMPGDAALDATLPFPVIRDPRSTLLPTKRVARRARELLRSHGATTVLFGASAPLGLLASGLRAGGAERLVAITHGHECWWARVPLARQALHRIGESTDCMTYLGDYTKSVMGKALSTEAVARMQQLTPGVDPAVFVPADAGAGAVGHDVRARLGIGPDHKVILCVGRLTARKGQDTLIRALPAVLAAEPTAVLVLVGGGAYRDALDRLAAETGVAASVRFTGPVPWAETPQYFAAGNVFAMPCRTRLGGLEPEAFGIVFLEAQSCGLPVLVGDSGGAPDTVRDGETGYVVEPSPQPVADRLVELLRDSGRAREMGAAGRTWVQTKWTWDAAGTRLRAILSDA